MVEDLPGAWRGTARIGVRIGAATVLTAGAFFLTEPLLSTDSDIALWVALASAVVGASVWGPAAGLVGTCIGLAVMWYALPAPRPSLDIAHAATGVRIAAAAVVAAVVLAGVRRERRASRRSLSARDEARAARAAAASASAASARLETLFAAAPAGLAYIDAEGRFSRVNAAFVEFVGVPAERLVSCPVWELPASVREAFDPWLERALDGQRTTGLELRLAGPGNGAPRYAVASVFPLSMASAPGEAGIVLQDVTALRSAERRLRLAQRMEAIGCVAGGVAHELNNQLTVVLGYTELLRHELGGLGQDGSDLDGIAQAAKRAAQVIGKLLAFTRQQVLQLRPVRIDRLLIDVSPELAEALGPQVDLLIRPDPTVQWIVADAEQLAQALVHLASNARDAMPNGGRLLIETEAVEVSSAERPEYPGVQVRPGRYARITVSDCGMGMPPQVRGRAFEPFFTTKAPVDGSGLGLSFVYGIVKQLDGYVWIDSTPGAGTTVRIDLPLVRDHAAPSEARVSDAAGLPPREQRELVAPGRAGAPARGVHA